MYSSVFKKVQSFPSTASQCRFIKETGENRAFVQTDGRGGTDGSNLDKQETLFLKVLGLKLESSSAILRGRERERLCG